MATRKRTTRVTSSRKQTDAPEPTLQEKLVSRLGRIGLIADIYTRMDGHCSDDTVRACRVLLLAIKTAAETSDSLEQQADIDRLRQELERTQALLGADRGGVGRASNSPAFSVPSERRAGEDN